MGAYVCVCVGGSLGGLSALKKRALIVLFFLSL